MRKVRSVAYSKSPLLEEDQHKWRSIFMLGFVFLLLLSLIGRAAYLQIYKQDFLQTKGEARYARNLTLHALRGKILDRNGEILAMSLPVKSVWASPEDANMSSEELAKLAKLLEMKPDSIKERIKGKKNFVYLKRQVEPNISKEIDLAKFPGIHQENTFKRYYTSGETSSHLTGFTDLEEAGQEGIELALNKHLSGIDGERKVLKNRRGQVIEEVGVTVEPQNGKDVTLTIDNRVQFIAATALEEAMKKHNAKAASAVVLDAKTGEILALVNYPTYNPNTREGLNGEKLRNRAITDIFEPGSTIKPFIIGMALEKKMVNENTLFNTKEFTVSNKKFRDPHPKDQLTVSQIIQRSSNVGTVQMGMRLSPKEMWDMFDTVGLGKKVGVGFPGEAKGLLRHHSIWKPIEQATMSFGHGLSVNLIQMAHAYLAFTNNGEVMPISLIKDDSKKEGGKRVFSEATAKKLQLMLESVTEKEGTASQARTQSYRVAGKTGTAHKLEKGRYTNKYIGSFIGFAPVSNPKIVVAVMVDEPRVGGGYYGGIVAAPVFAKIVEGSLKRMGVQPDVPQEDVLIDSSVQPLINDTPEYEDEVQGEASLQPPLPSHKEVDKVKPVVMETKKPIPKKAKDELDPLSEFIKSKGM